MADVIRKKAGQLNPMPRALTLDDILFVSTDGIETFKMPVRTLANLIGGGTAPVTPTVASVSSNSAVEGSPIVHNVTLTGTTSSISTYTFSIGGGTAVSGTDYNPVPTFNNGVTLSSGVLSVPIGVTSFTATVATIDDASVESTEAYTITIGGVAATGTITDNDVTPSTVTSVGNATGVEGSTLVHTVTLSAATPAVQSFSYTLGGGTATPGSDYTVPPTFSNGVTLAGSVLTVPTGVASFTVSVATIDDVGIESSETYTLAIGGQTGTGTITDNDVVTNFFVINGAGDKFLINNAGDRFLIS